MRKHILTVVCGIISLCAAAQNTKNVTSKITEVTIFIDNAAQITREASAEIPQGSTTLIFKKISPFVNDQTIQVKAPKGVTISSVKYQKNYTEKDEYSVEIEKLTADIEKLNNEINTQNTLLNATKAEIEFLKANQTIANGNATISVTSLRETYNFYGDKMKALLMEEMTLNTKITNLKKERDQLQRQLNQSQKTKHEKQGEIAVKVNASKTCTAKFELTYIVNGASWYPSYDIRVSDVDKPLNITYKANINQQTMVDWENVKIKLSAAQTNISGAAPHLNPYYLEYPRPIVRNNYKSRGKNSAAMMRVESAPQAAGGEMFEIADEEVVEDLSFTGGSGTTRNSYKPQQTGIQTAIEFEIKNKYTIKSGANDETIDMVEYSIPSKYQYLSIPKLNKNVYLTASFTDWQQYNMLTGDANIYFEDTYVGNTILDTEEYSDTMKVSLGVDKSISIKRESVRDQSKKQFIGTKRSDTRDWKITVKNNKQQKIDLTILDQVPVSKNTDIEVTVNEKSGGKQNEYGTIEWRFDLEPNASKELRLNYTVKYSKSKNLNVE